MVNPVQVCWMLCCRPLFVLDMITFCYNYWYRCAHNGLPIIFINLMKPERIDNTLGEELGWRRLLGWTRCNKMEFTTNRCQRGQHPVWRLSGMPRLSAQQRQSWDWDPGLFPGMSQSWPCSVLVGEHPRCLILSIHMLYQSHVCRK